MRKQKTLRKRFQAEWGTPRKELLDADELRDVAEYYVGGAQAADDSQWIVDETTWCDLDMDLVFQRMNHTQSSVGAEVLYAMLHRIDATNAALARRGLFIRHVSENTETRNRIQSACAEIGKARYHGAYPILFHSECKRVRCWAIYLVLALIPLAILVCGCFWPPCLLGLFLSFAVNLVVYYGTSRLWMHEVSGLRHIISVLYAAKKLSEICKEPFPDTSDALRALCTELKPAIRWNSIYAMEVMGDLGVLLDYVRILFQLDMIAYARLSSFLAAHADAIRHAYRLVGELDACTAIASWRVEQGVWAEPVWHAANEVVARGVSHPLVRNPVRNDMRWAGCALLTGSNASGKSTFLKAMAVNAILAQSIFTCCAVSIAMPRAQVLSSMALRDSVQAGESYFIVEIKSLRRMLMALQDDMPTLCFIDEILRGTNTKERVAASTALLRHLARQNALCLAATHDLELTRLLKEYRQYHFRETLSEGGMSFSYKLLEGPSDTSNAIELLKQMRFPESVVQEALKLSRDFKTDSSCRGL